MSLTSVRKLEKKIAKRLGEGVERLGVIIKDLAKAQRRLESRTSNLELKVLGQVSASCAREGSKTRKKTL